MWFIIKAVLCLTVVYFLMPASLKQDVSASVGPALHSNQQQANALKAKVDQAMAIATTAARLKTLAADITGHTLEAEDLTPPFGGAAPAKIMPQPSSAPLFAPLPKPRKA